jgi:RNA polymerase sigma factor (TIGR02999 family)
VTEDSPSKLSANLSGGTDDVYVAVYERLKVIAKRELKRSSGNTLNTTALVHELYLKMSGGRDLRFEEPVQFFIYAAKGMRHILLDRAKRRQRVKYGGDSAHVDLDHGAVETVSIDAQNALQFDAALRDLEKQDARAARVVELHYFAGLTLANIARLLAIASRTVDRDWRYARAFLHSRLEER